jgi:hypothetical protein
VGQSCQSATVTSPMHSVAHPESSNDHQLMAGRSRSDRAAICLRSRSEFEPVHGQGDPPVNPRRTACVDRDTITHVRSVSARTPRNSPATSGTARHENRFNHGLTGTKQHLAPLINTGRDGSEATSKPMGPRISGRRVRPVRLRTCDDSIFVGYARWVVRGGLRPLAAPCQLAERNRG